MYERTKIFIVMVNRSFTQSPPSRVNTVPKETKGIKIVRALTTLGYDDAHGHAEVHLRTSGFRLNMLLGEGRGLKLRKED